ncbi:hypothetical protein L873DRAFT_1677687 [Choiromyces venosus 120613-1]|uniref:Uncharacterized protein n=1 Tax=Choiromyces venosus 120613-1 TaxID=1336337 RepID=A0A3N4JS33_9PEZI|nr:hypothetical protein L873DRAFT_1677687 [Choiromyces venosus 120613-1]
MFKCGFSAAGLQQQKRSLLPGAERPEREHAWNKVKRATSIQATQEPKTAMFRTKLQPYSNHTSSNRPLARPMDNQSKSSKKLKLSSAMTGQVKANDASRRGTRARPANARPECSTSAINKPKFGRGKTCRGFRRDKTFPSHENRSWRGKMHTNEIRKGRSLKTTKKKRASLVQQHPLAKSFTGRSRLVLSFTRPVDRYLRLDHMHRPIAIFWNMLFLVGQGAGNYFCFWQLRYSYDNTSAQ